MQDAKADNEITEFTRRAIVDLFLVSKFSWSGDLQESVFLNRLYDLAKLPTTDSRMADAAGDIFQHRDSFVDWEDDWVFHDSRFALLWAPDTKLLTFLCETVHPAVRRNAESREALVAEYNRLLRADGWELYVASEMSGQPVYQARRIGSRIDVFTEPTGWDKVDRQIGKANGLLTQAENEEDFQSVGLACREALISVAQATYDPGRHGSNDGVPPSSTDAQRMLDAYFSVELGGRSNEEARAYAKAALKLALALQHKRTADFQMAALCIEATAGVINIAAILSGRRG